MFKPPPGLKKVVTALNLVPIYDGASDSDSDSNTSIEQDESTPVTIPSNRPFSDEELCTQQKAALISSHGEWLAPRRLGASVYNTLDRIATCDGPEIGRIGELLAAAALQSTHLLVITAHC